MRGSLKYHMGIYIPVIDSEIEDANHWEKGNHPGARFDLSTHTPILPPKAS